MAKRVVRKQGKRKTVAKVRKKAVKKSVKKRPGPKRAGKRLPVNQEPEALPAGVFSVQEQAVAATKYSYPEASRVRKSLPSELPQRYGVDRMVLQVRDPWWLHSFWEVGAATLDRFKGRLGDAFHAASWCLRVYDVTGLIFDGKNANLSFDIGIPHDTASWYIHTRAPGRSWCVDLGFLLPDGSFVTVLRSNVVRTPPDGPSETVDEEWLVPDDLFARLYGMGFGFGRSSQPGAWKDYLKQVLSSAVLSSPTSGAPGKPLSSSSFRLHVECELIVYGATEPGAHVSILGNPVALRPDGTFTLRFALPEGRQGIEVKAVSSDRRHQRRITPVISRQTK
ncbi:MAG: DUF4912 domain-containing protein [Candidatus Omnitrophica bacterium]|nr:DUF4912 domain-containing protein [Candidatus Omnitrophota bacterium]